MQENTRTKTQQKWFSVVKQHIASTKVRFSQKWPHFIAHCKTKVSRFLVTASEIELGPLFIFMASYWFIIVPLLVRIVGSIGLWYIYKEFIRDACLIKGLGK